MMSMIDSFIDLCVKKLVCGGMQFNRSRYLPNSLQLRREWPSKCWMGDQLSWSRGEECKMCRLAPWFRRCCSFGAPPICVWLQHCYHHRFPRSCRLHQQIPIVGLRQDLQDWFKFLALIHGIEHVLNNSVLPALMHCFPCLDMTLVSSSYFLKILLNFCFVAWN